MVTRTTFGDYVHNLRRARKMSLHALADATKLSYTHLSRLENNSIVPKAETVSKVASALDGDLKLMLELADCLPKEILDRMMTRPQAASVSLPRSAGRGGGGEPSKTGTHSVVTTALKQEHHLTEERAETIGKVVDLLVHLDDQQLNALALTIRAFSAEQPDDATSA